MFYSSEKLPGAIRRYFISNHVCDKFHFWQSPKTARERFQKLNRSLIDFNVGRYLEVRLAFINRPGLDGLGYSRQPSPPRDNLRERLYGFVTCKSCPLTSLIRDS